MSSAKTATSIFLPLRNLYNWVLKWADHKHNSKALAAITFVEASFFPIPPDPLLLAMGIAKPKKSLNYALLTTIFSVLGAMLGYYIGYAAWQAVEPLFFQYIISQEKFHWVMERFSDNVFMTVFAAGFSPIPFKIFTIAAGVASAPLAPFIAASVLSRGLRYFMIGGMVYFLGPQVKYWMDHYFERITIICTVILVLLVIAFQFLH